MEKQKEMAAVFKALNLENQKTLLVCALLSQIVENAVKKRPDKQVKQGTGPEYAVSYQGAQERVSLIMK